MRSFLFLLLLSPAFAAQSSWPIERLFVEGNRNYSQDQVLKVAELKPGQIAGKTEFDAARDRLLATGAFESVGYKFEPSRDSKGYVASFQVVEVTPVFPVRFEDLGLPDNQILEYLNRTEPLFAKQIPGTPAVLSHYAKAIEALLQSKGQPKPVAGRLSADNPKDVYALFRPAGTVPVIAELHFVGNKVAPAFALNNAIASSAIGVPYNEGRFHQTIDATLRPVYDAKGLIRVTFPKVQVEPAKDVKGLAVTITIDEGESYKLGDVKVNTPVLTAAELSKTANFKTGETANFDQVQEGIARMKTRLGSSGYMHPAISVERKIDDKARTVSLVMQVQPGPQYLFGKLDVQGLDLNGEAEIRRLWALKQGAPFKVDYPDFFLARVKEAGYFDNLKETRSVIKPDDAAHTVEVTLIFK